MKLCVHREEANDFTSSFSFHKFIALFVRTVNDLSNMKNVSFEYVHYYIFNVKLVFNFRFNIIRIMRVKGRQFHVYSIN